MSDNKVGGWEIIVKPCNLPQDVATAFSVVTENLKGAKYMPALYCATQVVNGTNHMIICKQTMITNPPLVQLVELTLHIEPNKIPSLISIRPIFQE